MSTNQKATALFYSVAETLLPNLDHKNSVDKVKFVALAMLQLQLKSLVQLDEKLCDAVVKLSENPAIERIKWQEQMWHKTIIQEVQELRGMKEHIEKI